MEPTLIDFENWLQDPILALRESYLRLQQDHKKGRVMEKGIL